MEPIEQIINEDFNVKKSKKKGLIIGGIIAAVIVIALVLAYFLVFANPKFIFSKIIDKIFAVETESYDSIKFDTKIKVSADLKDTTYQAELAEIEKCAIKLGAQMDVEKKQEIVELGLEYDNQSVVDAQIYYNDGEMFAYLEGLFDKYIKIDMDEEGKQQLDEMFSSINSKENKNIEKAVKIVKDELKSQIKEEGEFEKDTATIDIGDDEEKVTKVTLTLTQKELYNIASNMCSELAENDDFIDCFEKSPKDMLKEFASEIKNLEVDSKNKVRISIYTKGLLNKLVGVDIEVDSVEDNSTVVVSSVNEEEGIYSYKISAKASGIKMDFLNGKVEIEKDKDTKNEQSGKVTITAEVIETGSAKLEIDYSAEFNNGVDKIDTSNSININELTETDAQSIVKKLTERPLVGELIEKLLTVNQNSSVSGTEVQDDFLADPDTQSNLEKTLTTSQNEVKDDMYGYSVKYSVPEGFEYEEDYSYDYSKYFELEKEDSYIDANVSLGWYTESEYVQDEINWNYNYYKEETQYYKNVNLSQIKTIVVGDKTFKYVVLSYDSNSEYYEEKSQNVYVWYPLGDEYIFTVELEASDIDVTEEIIKGFLNITVTELN